MHYSAKRGLAIALSSVCTSICPSKCNFGGSGPDHIHIVYKSRKCTDTLALNCSPKSIHLLPREHGEILRRLEVGVGKNVLEHKSGIYRLRPISETRKDTEKGLRSAIANVICFVLSSLK